MRQRMGTRVRNHNRMSHAYTHANSGGLRQNLLLSLLYIFFVLSCTKPRPIDIFFAKHTTPVVCWSRCKISSFPPIQRSVPRPIRCCLHDTGFKVGAH